MINFKTEGQAIAENCKCYIPHGDMICMSIFPSLLLDKPISSDIVQTTANDEFDGIDGVFIDVRRR